MCSRYQQIQATHRAFAAILEDGSVVTWSLADYGGDSLAIRDELKGVQQIQATAWGAFAAILADGSVVTWGDAYFGGDSSAVRDQLRGVQQTQATAFGAFAAILADGSVNTWGNADHMQTMAVTAPPFNTKACLSRIMATWYSKQPYFFLTFVSVG